MKGNLKKNTVFFLLFILFSVNILAIASEDNHKSYQRHDSDNEYEKCLNPLAGQSCPDGEYLAGFTQQGNLLCRTLLLIQCKIVFTSTRNGDNSDIYSMNIDGSGVINIYSHPAYDISPVISPDGSIVFNSNRDDPDPNNNFYSSLYRMNADGTGLIRLTHFPLGQDRSPTVAPDGSIVFATYRDGNVEIYHMNSDGTGQINLTNNPSSDDYPVVDYDGTIIFGSNRDGDFEIYRMNADGSGQTRLTNSIGHDQHPAVFRDGRIVFTSGRNNFYTDIYIMNSNGTGQTNLTNNPTSYDSYPEVTVDGRIIFVSYRDGNFELYIMNADGSGVTNLTNHPSAEGEPAVKRF